MLQACSLSPLTSDDQMDLEAAQGLCGHIHFHLIAKQQASLGSDPVSVLVIIMFTGNKMVLS